MRNNNHQIILKYRYYYYVYIVYTLYINDEKGFLQAMFEKIVFAIPNNKGQT